MPDHFRGQHFRKGHEDGHGDQVRDEMRKRSLEDFAGRPLKPWMKDPRQARMTQAAVVDIGYVAAEPRDNDAALPTATTSPASIGPSILGLSALLLDQRYTYMNDGQRRRVTAIAFFR
jgi:hypothetical protein